MAVHVAFVHVDCSNPGRAGDHADADEQFCVYERIGRTLVLKQADTLFLRHFNSFLSV